MRKHGLVYRVGNRFLLWGSVLCVCLLANGKGRADTFHFNSGTITATYSGYETIGDTAFRINSRNSSLIAFGTVDGACGFCGQYSAGSTLLSSMPLGLQSVLFNGNPLTLWGGILISGNSFLLPDTAVGSFTAIRPVTISGQFVSPDGTFYQLAKHGRIYINFTAQDGNWSWDSAKIVLVPEPGTLMLFGTGLLFSIYCKKETKCLHWSDVANGSRDSMKQENC